MEDLYFLKLLLDIDHTVQEKMKVYEEMAGYGENEHAVKILVNWDNFIAREICLVMMRNFDIE